MQFASTRLGSGAASGCPVDALAFAHSMTRVMGSSTATVVVLNGTTLETVNLGDSGFVLLRKEGDKYKIFHRSKEQQHSFNMPYQLGTWSQDRPEHGDKLDLTVEA